MTTGSTHLALAAAALLAAAAPAAAAPDAAFRAAPVPIAPGPPNGDFSQGITGWTSLGPAPPVVTPVGTGGWVRLRANTTLLSSAVEIPTRAQTLSVVARSRRRGGVLLVRALRADGRQVSLGTIVPTGGFRRYEIGVTRLRGATVRVAVDPVSALGRSVDLRMVGPLRRPARGWSIRSGAPASNGRGLVRVSTGRLVMRSAGFRPGVGARAVQIQVRGQGRVRLAVGGRARSIAASSRRWRTLRVPIPSRLLAARVTVIANPGTDGLRLRRVGAVLRRPALRGVRLRFAGGRRVVTGRLAPAGDRLAINLRAAGGALLARGRTDARGRFRLAVRGVPAVLASPGDARRVRARWRL